MSSTYEDLVVPTVAVEPTDAEAEDTEPTEPEAEVTTPAPAKDSASAAARLLEIAARNADQLLPEAEAEAEAMRASARDEADELLTAARTEAERIRSELRAVAQRGERRDRQAAGDRAGAPGPDARPPARADGQGRGELNRLTRPDRPTLPSRERRPQH